MSKNTKASTKTPMTQAAVSRIMSASAKNNQGAVPARSFAAKAQSVVAKRSGTK